MNDDLDSVERKIEQVLVLCAQLHCENHTLRERVTELERQGESIASRVQTARTRLESLIEKLPAE